MLVSFAVDPSTFESPSEEPSAISDHLDRHARLIKFWRHFGILAIPNTKETDSDLYKAIAGSKTHQSIKKLWKTAWAKNRKNNFDEGLSTALSANDDRLLCGYDSTLQAAVLDATRASLWGLADDEFTKNISPRLEIFRLGHEEHSVALSESQALSVKPIEPGDTGSKIWSERIASLVDASNEITIVDRYAAVQHFSNSDSNARSRTNNKCGMFNTLERISRSRLRKGFTIKVNFFVAITDELKNRFIDEPGAVIGVQHVFEDMVDDPRLRGLRELNLFWASDKCFGAKVHYRYIRFDDKSALLLDTGLESLGDKGAHRTCPTQYLGDWQSPTNVAFRAAEHELRGLCSTKRYTPTAVSSIP